jgi:hypothetical protein
MTPNNLWSNQHLERSTIPCIGLPPPPNHQYSPPYPSLFPLQAYQNSQAQAPAYYQSYHYATTNRPQPPPTPQITYPPVVPQITYPVPINTNPQVKTEANPLPLLRHKSKSLCNNPIRSPPMAQFSQLPEVPTPTLTPRDNVEITTK